MGFLNLIEQYNRVGMSPDCFCQLATLLISYISGRRSDQTGYGVFLHILTHIDTHHILFIIEQAGCQCLCKLCLTNTGRSKEQEGTNRFGWILDACFGTDNRIRYLLHTFILTDNPFMEFFVQMEGFISLTLRQFCHRNTGPAGNDSCNLFICYAFMYQRQVFILNLLFLVLQLLLQLRQTAILKLCCFLQVIPLLGSLNLFVHILDLLTEFREILHGFLLVIPLCFLIIKLIPQISQLLLEILQTFLTKTVCLFLKSCFLNLQLQHFPAQLVKLGRHGIQFRLNKGTGFIYQINGFVRQKTLGNITMGQGCRCHQGRVCDLNPVEYFVTFFQTSQDGNRIFYGRLVNQYLLETALQSRIFLNVLTVFIQRGRTDTMKLASCQKRFQQVTGIHGAIGLTCAYNQMQFIDEQDNLSFTLSDFFQNCFQTLLKFTSVFGTCYQRAHIQ